MESLPTTSYPEMPQPVRSLSGGLSPETEKLFNKWLKMQIAAYYWGMFSKVVIFLLVIGSLVFSTFTLAPFLQSQLSTLQSVQSMFSGLSSGTYGMQSPVMLPVTNQPAVTSTPSKQQLNDIITKLTPEQKQQVIDSLNRAQ